MTQAQVDARLAELQQEFEDIGNQGGDLTVFEAKIRLFTEQHPREAEAYVTLGLARVALLRWSDAYQAFLSAIRLKPGVYQWHQLAGFCSTKMNDNDQALGHYLDALEVAGDAADYTLYTNLGQLYLVLDQLDEAERSFTLALDAPPPPGEDTNWRHQGYSGLADVAAVRGDFEKAQEFIDLAIRFNPGDSGKKEVGYMIQKAWLYMDQGRDDEALRYLRDEVHRRHPDSAGRIESVRLRARLYERAGDLGAAVDHVSYYTWDQTQQPERIDAELANFFALQAEWQIKAGQFDAARHSLTSLENLAPQHTQLQSLRDQLP